MREARDWTNASGVLSPREALSRRYADMVRHRRCDEAV